MKQKTPNIGWFKKGHKINVGSTRSQETKAKLRACKIGSNNHQWERNGITYSAVHKWLARNFKKEKCGHCHGKRFLEWALIRGKSPTHNRNNYKVLCSSCHKRYDYTTERKAKLSASLKGRKITWNTRPQICQKPPNN